MFKTLLGSGFLVRSAHVILTWVVTLILFLHDTDLRRQEESAEFLQPLLFVLLVLLSVLLYFTVSLMDPGFVLSDTDAKFSLDFCEEQQEMMAGASSSLRQRRCGHCLLLVVLHCVCQSSVRGLVTVLFLLPSPQQPMRAKHCQTCRHCVRRYDHHCPWIENCVGERNHRWFVLYLLVQLVVLLWGSRMAWSGFSSAPSWESWLRSNGFLLGASCLLVVFTIVVVLLLGSHLFLISTNTTTWEFMSRHRISYLRHCSTDENPFDHGTVCNLWSFFCVCRTVAWEQVYLGQESGPV